MSVYVNENIKELRKKRNMTQKELAEKSGLSIAAIQGYEQGKYIPKTDARNKLAYALEVLPEDIVGLQTFNTAEEFHKAWEEGVKNAAEGEEITIIHKASPELRIDTALSKLNESGRDVAADRVEELTEIPKYRK